MLSAGVVPGVNDPSRTVVAKITVQPGAQFPWHTHPGPVIVNIAQGELTYIMAHDCVDRPYAAGTAFVDPGRGMVHTAVNRTGEVTVLLVTFFEVPETGLLTIPPTWVVNTPTPTHPFFRMSYRGWQREIPSTEVIWGTDPNPLDPYARGARELIEAAEERLSEV